jgi:putative hemin transport protein
VSLIDDWERARARGLNNRAAALELGVPEASLVASGCGRFVTRMSGEFAQLLGALPALGEIKSVVRNAYAVQERAGRAKAIVLHADGAITIDGDTFVLQADANAWARGFALVEPGKYGIKRSLQFFADSGESAVKFFLTGNSSRRAFEALVGTFAAADQTASEAVAEAKAPAAQERPGQRASLAAFLYEAARLAQPVEITVANRVASQRTAKVPERIKRSDRGGWINVLDPGLDLHLHEQRIRSLRVEGDTFHWIADDGTEAFSARSDVTEALLHASLG